MTRTRLWVALAVLALVTVVGWIARRQVECYAANELLFELIEINDAEAIAWAARAGADLNERGLYGRTPLHYAAYLGYPEAVTALTTAGADVDARGGHWGNPDSHLKWEGWTPLHLACVEGHPMVVQQLIRVGADVTAGDSLGRMPLHSAARYGNSETVRILIRAGADVNARTNSEDTPLHAAAAGGHVRTVRQLLGAGAEANATNLFGLSPLDFASDVEVFDLLRQEGARTRNELREEPKNGSPAISP